MRIFIFSHKRADRQTTFANLPTSIQYRTQHIVYEDELEDYTARGYNCIGVPKEHYGIGKKRQWVLDTQGGRAVFLDDDLTFATRRQDEPAKFTDASFTDIEAMFQEIDHCFAEGYVHGGVSHREGANRDIRPYIPNNRIMRFHFYDLEIMHNAGIRFDRVPCMEDFDVTLQLLRRGIPNIRLNDWVHNQGGSNTDGGCSEWRTDEVQAEGAELLQKYHPRFVRIRQVETGKSWNGKPRTDVTIQWKRAADEGTKNGNA